MVGVFTEFFSIKRQSPVNIQVSKMLHFFGYLPWILPLDIILNQMFMKTFTKYNIN